MFIMLRLWAKNTCALFGTVFRIRNSFSRVPGPDPESHARADLDPDHEQVLSSK